MFPHIVVASSLSSVVDDSGCRLDGVRDDDPSVGCAGSGDCVATQWLLPRLGSVLRVIVQGRLEARQEVVGSKQSCRSLHFVGASSS